MIAATETPILGHSEMAHLTRALDWSMTPLGSLCGWSSELLAILNMALAAPLPTLIYWGPELVLFYNDAAIPIASSKHPGALGRSAREVWQEAWHIVGPEVEQVLTTGASVSHQGVLVPLLKDGRIQDLYWNYSYSPLFQQGHIAGTLLICQEITESFHSAQKLRVNETRLSSISNQLHQVLAATTDAIVSINRNWEFTYLNPAGIATYARDRDLLGKNVWEEFPEAVYEGSPYIEYYERAMHQGIAGTFEAYYPDPLNIWIRLSVFPTQEGIVTFSRDITEEKRIAAALIQNEKLAAVGRLASSIAHEINNPLEAVTNLLYIARGSENLPEIQYLLNAADEELRRVAVIANQTLGFHKQSSRPVATTCSDLLTNVLTMFRAKLRNAHIQVEERTQAPRPVLVYDGDIRQVLANLIGNAIDAMPTGGRLIVRSRESRDQRTGALGLTLTVADTGVGIPAGKRKKIFDAFFTTKGIGGTGLGLWISVDIMRRHGGRIRVRSSQRENRRGTVVTLFLPYDSPLTTL